MLLAGWVPAFSLYKSFDKAENDTLNLYNPHEVLKCQPYFSKKASCHNFKDTDAWITANLRLKENENERFSCGFATKKVAYTSKFNFNRFVASCSKLLVCKIMRETTQIVNSNDWLLTLKTKFLLGLGLVCPKKLFFKLKKNAHLRSCFKLPSTKNNIGRI